MKSANNTHWRIVRLQLRIMREEHRCRTLTITESAYMMVVEMWHYSDMRRFIDSMAS